jgi:hypothetical protein
VDGSAWFWPIPVPEIIDPVFAKTNPKRSVSNTEYERFGLVSTKTRVYKFGHRKRLMSFSRPNQWYHSHVDPIWPDGTGTFKKLEKKLLKKRGDIYKIERLLCATCLYCERRLLLLADIIIYLRCEIPQRTLLQLLSSSLL